MTGKIYFMMGSTFCIGMLAGAYLYVTVFAPTYKSDIETSEAQSEDEVVIEGSMYGGCMESDACPSFRLLSNGSYSYLEYPDAEVVKGRIPNDIASAVFENIGTNTFFNNTEPISSDSCESYVDGNDYSYMISLGDEVYTLDTCTTAFAYDTDFQASLFEVWNSIENPTKTYPSILEKGVGGFFIDRFQNAGNESTEDTE